MSEPPMCGAPAKADNEEEIKALLVENLSRLETGDEGPMELIEIQNATRQVVAGSLYKIKGVFKHGNGDTVNCEVKIWLRPWIQGDEGCQIDLVVEDGRSYFSNRQ